MREEFVEFEDLYVDHFIYKGEINMSAYHRHPYFELMHILNGRRQIFFPNGEYVLSKENLVLIPPNFLHRTKSHSFLTQERFVLYFKKEFIEKHMCKEINDIVDSINTPIVLSNDEMKKIAPFFNILITVFREPDNDLKEQSLKMCFLSIFVEFIKIIKEKNFFSTILSTKDSVYYEVVKYIDKNFIEKISLDDLAEKFGISKYQLSKKLNMILGVSWVTYINTLRIAKAQNMLLESQSNILNIALSLGFGSITHFERVFKSMTNYSPTQYIHIMNNLNSMPSNSGNE